MIPFLLLLAALAQADKHAPGLRRFTRRIRKLAKGRPLP